MAQVASEISETVPAAAYAPDGFESARAEEAAAAPTEAAPEAAPVEAAPTLQVSLETAAAEAASATELAAAAADGAAAAAAAASVVPADAALRAAEIAARLAAEHGPPGATAYPVSSGMDHATEDSNKRKFNGPESYEGNDVAKRAYTEGQYHANNGATLQPIAPPEGHQPQYTGMEEATEIIMCPSTFVGKVIGKGGETIRDLQNRSSARIQIDHTGEEGRPRAITISGNRYAVDTAKKLVEDVISQGQDPSGVASQLIICCLVWPISTVSDT